MFLGSMLPAEVMAAAPVPPRNVPADPGQRSFRIQRPNLPNTDETTPDTGANGQIQRLIIDTDPGVDDAAALVALLSQRQYAIDVVGIVTVAGNSDAESGARNVVNILQAMGRNYPVVVGSTQPLVRPLTRTSKLLHGPDGLWFLGIQMPTSTASLSRDPVKFYCTDANLAGVTILTLGPLTNVARAIDACPEKMRTVGRFVVLGGAKYGGNIVPNAEFNFWQDPEAAQKLLTFVAPPPGQYPPLAPQPPLTIVPVDAFSQFTVKSQDLARIERKGNRGAQFILPALRTYIGIQEENGGKASLPDVAVVAYALNPGYGLSSSALVKVMAPPEGDPLLRLVRGQTVVGLTANERISMIADDAQLSALADQAYSGDPNFNLLLALGGILLSGPDNAQFVTDIKESRIQHFFVTALTR